MSDDRLYYRIAYGRSAWHLVVLFSSAWSRTAIESATGRIPPLSGTGGGLSARERAPRDLESRCPDPGLVHVASSYDPFLSRVSPRVCEVYVDWLLDSWERIARILARTTPHDRLVVPVRFLCRFMMDRFPVSARAHDSLLSHAAGYLTMVGPRRAEMLQVLAAREEEFERVTAGTLIWKTENAAEDDASRTAGELLSVHRDLMRRLGGLSVGEFVDNSGSERSQDAWSDLAEIHRATVLDDGWLSEHRKNAAWVQYRFEINVAYQMLSQVGVGYTDRIAAAFVAFNTIERRLGGKPESVWERQWKS